MPTYNLDEFARRVGSDIYNQMAPALELVYLKTAMDVYNNLVELTPVDTGYLRLSLTTAINGEEAFEPPPRNPKAKTGDYIGASEDALQANMEALVRYRLGDIVDIGYTANYAPYVEDRYHMVKTVGAMIRSLLRNNIGAARKGLGI